jgi:hypothetical protein
MARFYQPDLSQNIDSPFVRDGDNKLVRRCYWLDIDDRILVMMMVNGIGENSRLTRKERFAPGGHALEQGGKSGPSSIDLGRYVAGWQRRRGCARNATEPRRREDRA